LKHVRLLTASAVLIQSNFFSLMRVVEEDTQINCLKRGADWMLESFVFV